ncbi:hypothetical protein K8R42_02515 [bacterium]|nr:hypothetical protein [bacterium]
MPTAEDLAAQSTEGGAEKAVDQSAIGEEAPNYEGLPAKVVKRLKRQEGMTAEEKEQDNQASYRASRRKSDRQSRFNRNTGQSGPFTRT